MLTDNEIDRIAASVNALRPDWPVKSLRTLLETKLVHRTRRDVVVALAWIASDSDTKTPARVLESGPWWQGLGQEVRVPRNPLPHEECSKHVGEYRLSCGPCRSEKLAPVVELHPRETTQETLDWRTALAAAKAGLCSHGVTFDHCTESHESEPA